MFITAVPCPNYLTQEYVLMALQWTVPVGRRGASAQPHEGECDPTAWFKLSHPLVVMLLAWSGCSNHPRTIFQFGCDVAARTSRLLRAVRSPSHSSVSSNRDIRSNWTPYKHWRWRRELIMWILRRRQATSIIIAQSSNCAASCHSTWITCAYPASAAHMPAVNWHWGEQSVRRDLGMQHSLTKSRTTLSKEPEVTSRRTMLAFPRQHAIWRGVLPLDCVKVSTQQRGTYLPQFVHWRQLLLQAAPQLPSHRLFRKQRAKECIQTANQIKTILTCATLTWSGADTRAPAATNRFSRKRCPRSQHKWRGVLPN